MFHASEAELTKATRSGGGTTEKVISCVGAQKHHETGSVFGSIDAQRWKASAASSPSHNAWEAKKVQCSGGEKRSKSMAPITAAFCIGGR